MSRSFCITNTRICLFRPGARDPKADLQAQARAEEAEGDARGGVATSRRESCTALHPTDRGAPRAAGERKR